MAVPTVGRAEARGEERDGDALTELLPDKPTPREDKTSPLSRLILILLLVELLSDLDNGC